VPDKHGDLLIIKCVSEILPIESIENIVLSLLKTKVNISNERKLKYFSINK